MIIIYCHEISVWGGYVYCWDEDSVCAIFSYHTFNNHAITVTTSGCYKIEQEG